MVICYLIAIALALVVVVYLCLEIHYFLRVLLAIILARLLKKKVNILQETSVKGICLATDIDTFMYHMNNARFMRELDFARVDFYERTGLYKCIRRHGGTLAMGAASIRYRRFIRLFHRYMITSRIVYWDSQSIFMEHRFITPSDGFVNAIVLARTRLIDCNAEEVMKELLKTKDNDPELGPKEKMDMPQEVEKFLEMNEISSTKLRGASQNGSRDCLGAP